MQSYQVVFKKSAQKEFLKLPLKMRERVLDVISFLKINPYSENLDIKKIKGAEQYYRLRVGDYRVIYEIQDSILLITVIKIRHRKEVYR